MTKNRRVPCKGGREVSREELAMVSAPTSTETWFPIRHDTCVATVQRALADSGFGIRAMHFTLFRNDARLFATVDLACPLTAGVHLAVAIMNSFDKSLPLGFLAGNRVLACANVAFRSNLSVRFKHSRFGDHRYDQAVSQVAKDLQLFKAHETERIRRLQSAQIDDRSAESLILRAYERSLISSRALPGIIREWRKPSFMEFQHRTAWSLLNAFTSILAERLKSNAQVHASLTIGLGELFDAEFGVEPFAICRGDDDLGPPPITVP